MIPKIIHCIWFSGDEKPELIKHCMATWKEMLPDYEIREWGLKDVEQIRKQNAFFDKALSNKQWAFAADFLRLWILYNVGGIYLDTDVEVLKSFDPFLNNGFFTCYECSKGIEAAVMGSEKGNKFAKLFLERFNERDFDAEINTYGRLTVMPFFMADIICEKFKTYRPTKKHVEIENFHIYPQDYFSPKEIYNGKIKLTKNSVCIHQFNGGWVKKKKLTFKTKLAKYLNYVSRKLLSYPLKRKITKSLYKKQAQKELKTKQKNT